MQQKLITWYKGHTVLEVDTEQADAVAAAEELFAMNRATGFLAVRTAPGKPEALRQYDPLAETIEFVLPIQGG